MVRLNSQYETINFDLMKVEVIKIIIKLMTFAFFKLILKRLKLHSNCKKLHKISTYINLR